MGNLYKVTSATGASQNGGTLQWSLPTADAPGEWHEVSRVDICSRGLHLTSDPCAWWKEGSRCFLAEGDGDPETEGDKTAFRRARLIRELTTAELDALGIWTEGAHEISEGKAFAYDSASVEAYGSASVRASGSASVRAYGSASVEAYDSASVRASGSASVVAYGSASVVAYGSASVRASGSASVRAYGSASVEAYGSARVEAAGRVTVTQPHDYGTDKPVALAENAVCVDQRGDRPVVRIAGQE